jgi:hypothetical protein
VSSGIFQKRLNQELLGLEGVKCIADDILVYGTNEKDDDQNFERLLERCKEKSIKLTKDLVKCKELLQGMMIRLQKYDIEVKYEKGRLGSNVFLADKLSRASIHGDEKSGPEFEAINMMKYLLISDERLKEIQRETKSDESLQILTTVIRQGWPEQKEDLPNVVAPYFNIRDEMSRSSV